MLCPFQIWVMAFCVTFVFTVTLSVFPAVTADVKTIFHSWGMRPPPLSRVHGSAHLSR